MLFLWKLLFLFFCVFLCHQTLRVCAGDVSVHVANLTLHGFGWLKEDGNLKPLHSLVQSTVCGQLTKGTTTNATTCDSFLLKIDENQFSLHMSAETPSFADSFLISRVFREWVEGNATELLRDVTTAFLPEANAALTPPSKIGGVYTMPCRGSIGKKVLPLCTLTNNCWTTLLIYDMKENPGAVFCPLVPEPCGKYILFNTTSDERMTMLTISNLLNTLEIALIIVDFVRKGRLSVKSIQLLSDGRTAELYTINENITYPKPIKPVLHCSAVNALWVVFLLGFLPMLFFIFCYVWSRGRRSGKKEERKAIIDDEMHLQNVAESSEKHRGTQQSAVGESEYPLNSADNYNNYYYYYEDCNQEQDDRYYDEAGNEMFLYSQKYADQEEEEEEQQYEDYYQQEAAHNGEGYETADEHVGCDAEREGDAGAS